jgi:septal ring factor EnvC (AmiA/AmiB activator)
LWVAVAVLVAVMVAMAGVITWLMASTVPTDDYDAAQAELESAQEQVTALTEERSDLTAERDSLTDERDQLVASVAATAVAAKALAYIDLNVDPLFVEEMVQAGTDFTPYDELLATLGEDVTLAEWVSSYDAFRMAERYVYETDDA